MGRTKATGREGVGTNGWRAKAGIIAIVAARARIIARICVAVTLGGWAYLSSSAAVASPPGDPGAFRSGPVASAPPLPAAKVPPRESAKDIVPQLPLIQHPPAPDSPLPHRTTALASSASIQSGYGIGSIDTYGATPGVPPPGGDSGMFATCLANGSVDYAAPCASNGGTLVGGGVPGFNYFTALRNDRPLNFIHFEVPYDIAATANSNGQCAYTSVVDKAGILQIYDLYWALQAAKAQNLTVLITLTNGQAPGDTGANVYPSWAQYFCGAYYLMATVNGPGWAQSGYTPYVTEWEAYNEPDTSQGCASGCVAVPTNTAGDYYLEALQAQSYLGRSDQVAAGSFNFSDAGGNTGYAGSYMYYLAHHTSPSNVPIWSDHPYDDVTSVFATNNVASFESAVVNAGFPVSQIWLTETGHWLDDPHYPSTTDGNAGNQYWASQAFIQELGRAPYVNQVYWYEMAATGYSGDGVGWDSGLLDGNGSPRDSYCGLVYPNNPGSCVNGIGPGDPNDYWSVPF